MAYLSLEAEFHDAFWAADDVLMTMRERKLKALKSDFVASVSHERRAPIAPIRLMADVLDFARIEQGRKHWHFEETDLRELVLKPQQLITVRGLGYRLEIS